MVCYVNGLLAWSWKKCNDGILEPTEVFFLVSLKDLLKTHFIFFE